MYKRLLTILLLQVLLAGCSDSPNVDDLRAYLSYHIEHGDTSDLREDLASDLRKTRLAAILVYSYLPQISPEAIVMLNEIVQGPDPQLAYQALLALCHLGPPTSVEAIEIALCSPNERLAKTGSIMLLKQCRDLEVYKDRLLSTLVNSLDHRNSDTAENVAIALFIWGEESGVSRFSLYEQKKGLDKARFGEEYRLFRLHQQESCVEIRYEDFDTWLNRKLN